LPLRRHCNPLYLPSFPTRRSSDLKAYRAFPFVLLVLCCGFVCAGVYIVRHDPRGVMGWVFLIFFSALLPVTIRMIWMCRTELVITDEAIRIRGTEIERTHVFDARVIRVESRDSGALRPARILRLRHHGSPSVARWMRFQTALTKMNLHAHALDGTPVHGENVLLFQLNET